MKAYLFMLRYAFLRIILYIIAFLKNILLTRPDRPEPKIDKHKIN